MARALLGQVFLFVANPPPVLGLLAHPGARGAWFRRARSEGKAVFLHGGDFASGGRVVHFTADAGARLLQHFYGMLFFEVHTNSPLFFSERSPSLAL